MKVRGTLSGSSQNISWDVENRPVSLTSASVNATFVYDGDGNRVKKVENGVEILYINKYYEVNLTGGNATSYYYLGDRLVAMNSTSLRYIHQDHLSGTSVITDTSGVSVGTMKYHPYGSTRSGSVPTDKKFTGQRLDDTGLYYYNARYYDPSIGRFISADTVVSRPFNPQSFNRYSYVLNNPLKYVDPTGHQDESVDSWYESLCETYSVDPGDGIAFVFGPEGFAGTLDIDTFIAWVDETDNPFDYTSAYDIPLWMEGLGVTNAFYYHADLKADPIVVAELGRDSTFLSFLNFIGIHAITINPYILIPEVDLPPENSNTLT